MPTLTKAENLAPERLKMSYEQYLDAASDTQIMEWVNGEVIVYMPPTDRHQALSLFLSELLHAFIRFFDLGALRYAPFEVKLWPDGPSREPDILFVSNDRLSQLTSKRFEGGPDLIVEIISPGSVTEDRVHKFTHYQKAGVREYWIIDPRPYQQQADFFTLGEDELYHPAPPDEKGRYHSIVLPNFWLDVNWLWQEDLRDPQLILAEIMISIDDLPVETKDTYQSLYHLLADKS